MQSEGINVFLRCCLESLERDLSRIKAWIDDAPELAAQTNIVQSLEAQIKNTKEQLNHEQA